MRNITKEQIEYIKELGAEGLALKEIQRLAGVSQHYVYRVLRPDHYERKIDREMKAARVAKPINKLVVPDEVLAERDRALSYPEDPLGGPPPIRSALFAKLREKTETKTTAQFHVAIENKA